MNQIDRHAREWEETSNLFSVFLGQDFDIFGETPTEAVRAFTGMASEQRRRGAARGVRRVLDECADEAELDGAAERLGAGVSHPAGSSWRQWLTEIAEILEHPGSSRS